MDWSTMDLNRHTGDRVAPPGNKSTNLKESSESLSLHLANLFTARTWHSLCQENCSGHHQLPVTSPSSLVLRLSLNSRDLSHLIRNTTLYLGKTIGWLLGNTALEEEALGNGTHRKRGLEGSDSSSPSVTCFLCSAQPIISTRQFPYSQNEDIATYLTGHTTKSIRKESELPKAIWPVTDNFGRP